MGISKSRDEPFGTEKGSRKSLGDFPEAFLQHVCNPNKARSLAGRTGKEWGKRVLGDLEIAPCKMPNRDLSEILAHLNLPPPLPQRVTPDDVTSLHSTLNLRTCTSSGGDSIHPPHKVH